MIGPVTCDAGAMAELAGRLYIPKLYNIDGDRGSTTGRGNPIRSGCRAEAGDG